MITVHNSQILNLDELLSNISTCEDNEMLASLLNELSSYTSQGTVDFNQARTLLSAINSRMENLKANLSQKNSLNQSHVKKLSLTPNKTAISNRAGIVSSTLLIASLSVTAIMFALLLLAR